MTNNIKKTKKVSTVEHRINNIKDLMCGKCIEPMVNFDITETENFTGPILKGGEPESDSSTNDTRYVLGKKKYDLFKVISEMNGELIYIKSGAFGHTFKGEGITKSSNKYNFAFKVVAYPKTIIKKTKEKIIYNDNLQEIYDIERPENAELKMIKLLSQFTINLNTPHIVLPIATFNTNIKYFVKDINDIVKADHEYKSKYEEFIEKYNEGKFHDEVSILMSEWANCGDFGRFCKENKRYRKFTITEWKVFFFQVLSVLAMIQAKYPSFRHNDLKPNNVLIDKHTSKKSPVYTINKVTFEVPNIGYHLKIWDFDFACIPGYVENKKVNALWTSKFKVDPVRNQYYDVHYFFNTLTRYGFIKDFFIDEFIPQDVKDFINRVVPAKYQIGKYVHNRGRLLHDKEYLTPFQIISTDPFFEEFRKKVKKKKSNHSSLLNNTIASEPEKKIKRVRKEKETEKESNKTKNDFEELINSIRNGKIIYTP